MLTHPTLGLPQTYCKRSHETTKSEILVKKKKKTKKMLWLEGAIAFTLTIYVFESYLDYRQYQNLCAEKPPSVLLSAIKDDALKKKILIKFQDSQAYGRAKAKFGAFRRFIDEILENGLLLLYFGPTVWNWAEVFADEYFSSDDVIVKSLLWIGIQHYLFLPLSIPFQYYSQFVVEERFGFNKMTLKLFITDLIKQEFLTVLIGAPLMALTLKIIDWVRDLCEEQKTISLSLSCYPQTRIIHARAGRRIFLSLRFLHSSCIHSNHDIHLPNVHTTLV